MKRLVALTIAAIMTTAAATQAEDRLPVLLRSSILQPPVESAGTGLAPEVGVQVDIDERGRVTAVDVRSIKPSSELDEIFRQHTVDQLLQWRYAPAIVDGRPSATSLEWKVQYLAGEEVSSTSSPGGYIPPFLFAKADAEARHAQLLSLPLDKQKEILRRYVTVAEKYIDPQRRQKYETERFVVVTDAEHAETAGIVARNLEVSLSVVGQLLQPHLMPQPTHLKFIVYLYATRNAFSAMRRDLASLSLGEATYYAPGFIIYHLEVPSGEYLQSFLIHEASHAYSDRHVRRPGFSFPRWLEEGFAEYMGNSQIKKGKLLPGRTLKRRFVLNHYTSGARAQNTVAGWDLERVQRALARGEGLTLPELISADRDVFYGDRSNLYYGMSWLFVHYLRHGEPGWEDVNFAQMMLYMAEGYPAKAALETAYGRDTRDFEAPFLDYVKRF
ncbi:MAG: energy transducer TonB [Acidobacteriota bacterium]